MSYDIDLCMEDGVCDVDRHKEGGTYALGGIAQASLNITYNYVWFFRRFIDKEEGIRWLYGKRASETIERLGSAVAELGTDRFENYWAPTPGNAGHALSILLKWARQHPEAIWKGD